MFTFKALKQKINIKKHHFSDERYSKKIKSQNKSCKHSFTGGT